MQHPTPARRVAVVGAQGTGKTTLCRLLAEATGYPLIAETARPILAKHGIKGDTPNVPPDLRMQVQGEMLTAYWNRRVNAPANFIADRCELDVWAYSHLWLAQEPTAQHFLRKLTAMTRHALQRYDLILLVPPHGGDVEDDGVRSAAFGFQTLVHALFVGGLKTFAEDSPGGLPICTVFPKDLPGRVEYAARLIRFAPNVFTRTGHVGHTVTVNPGDVPATTPKEVAP